MPTDSSISSISSATTNLLTAICVFSGSSNDISPLYFESARALGHALVAHKIGLVYGGGNCGLMGAVASTVHPHCPVTGIIPSAFLETEGDTFGECIVVPDMHTRKSKMTSLASAFIALPGGFGTIEELMEVITWTQLNIHTKPVGILNVNGFFTPLLQMFEKACNEGFIKRKYLDIMVVSEDPNELIEMLKKHETPKGVYANWENAKII